MRRMIPQKQIDTIEDKLSLVTVEHPILGKFVLNLDSLDEESFYLEDGYAVYEGYFTYYSEELEELGWSDGAGDRPYISFDGLIDTPNEEADMTFEEFKEFLEENPAENLFINDIDEAMIEDPEGNSYWPDIREEVVEDNPEHSIMVALGYNRYKIDGQLDVTEDITTDKNINAEEIKANKINATGTNGSISAKVFSSQHANISSSLNIKSAASSVTVRFHSCSSVKMLDITTEGSEEEFTFPPYAMIMGNTFVWQTIHLPETKYQFRLKGVTLSNAPIFAKGYSNDDDHIHISFSYGRNSNYDWIDVVVDATEYTGYYHTIMIDIASVDSFNLVDYNA